MSEPTAKTDSTENSKAHCVRAGSYRWNGESLPTDPNEHRRHIEPWLAALLQAEHVNLLIGSGLTTAVAALADVPAIDMKGIRFACDGSAAVDRAATESARRSGRGEPNLEDQIRTVREFLAGLRVLAMDERGAELAVKAASLVSAWESGLDACLRGLLNGILSTERDLAKKFDAPSTEADLIRQLLCSFLLSFASRTATRDRLHIFTTNYDRLIEYGSDLLGLRILDRFVGGLKPVFRASRLGIDLHYNPPGIRGEPRYLEGVVRLSKLHGSIDWRQEKGDAASPRVARSALPFGALENHPDLPEHPRDGLIIYPNPAKDIETLEYPYAELFRDFAAAVCQPNAVLITYGYGFGDDHINRTLRDMLTIPSAHLAIISFDGAAGRIERFVSGVGREEQITLLIGSHFGDLRTLVTHYLPKPAIDKTTWRMVELVNRRTPHPDMKLRSEPEAARGEGAE